MPIHVDYMAFANQWIIQSSHAHVMTRCVATGADQAKRNVWIRSVCSGGSDLPIQYNEPHRAYS